MKRIAKRTAILSAEQFDARLKHTPRKALARARKQLAQANAGDDPARQLDALLRVIAALNALGEFRAALDIYANAEALSAALDNAQASAWMALEAARAESYLGNLDAAGNYLERVNAGMIPDTLQRRAQWIRGRILIERGEYAPALEIFRALHAAWDAEGETHTAMQVRVEIGHALARVNPPDALSPLETARAFFVENDCPVDVALCDLYAAQALMDLNRFDEARARLEAAEQTLTTQGVRFFAAYAMLEFGFLGWFLNRFDEMLTHSQRAHAAFTEVDAVHEIATSEINIGMALVELNRYSEALPYFGKAYAGARASGRRVKAAVCLMNIGEVHEKQEQYADALDAFRRAHSELEAHGSTERLITCDLLLGRTLTRLAQYDEARAALDDAEGAAQAAQMTTRLAQTEPYRALLLHAQRKTRAAIGALKHALPSAR